MHSEHYDIGHTGNIDHIESKLTPLGELNLDVKSPSFNECAFMFVKALVGAYDTGNEAQKLALLESIDPVFAEQILLDDLINYLDKINSEGA
ncbi:hypothetical protein [Vibrio harveyi]|uniref:hypothetical protein n=1 Tax=Vibrio harveyi TaxID=669 RepID=UPI0006831E61|nr:hypothetical protein [Vibrio harveyi]PNM43651.1 hypothetical protein AL469_027770 [Vibrio harveyi]